MGFVMPLYGGTRARFTQCVRVCVCAWACVSVPTCTCVCVCDWVIECVCTIHCSGLSDSLWIGIDFLSSALFGSLLPSLPSSFLPLLSLLALYQRQQSRSSAFLPWFHFCSLCNRQRSFCIATAGTLVWNIMTLSMNASECVLTQALCFIYNIEKLYIT